MRGSTFFGRDRPFEQDFSPPEASGTPQQPWYISARGIEAKAKEFDIPLPTETQEWPSFRDNVFQHCGVTQTMYEKAQRGLAEAGRSLRAHQA
jgi:hypothetical protein